MKLTIFHHRFVGVIGNFLEHYDNALFGLLAPFIAPLFFVKTDPFTALILTYSILPLGFFTRPLGALFFGWIGDHWGRRQALFYSLFGMAIVSVGIGFLPTYMEWGIYSPFLLALARMLQSFFAAGEATGGAIFVLEQTPSGQRGFMSSFYDATSIAGILVASGLVTWMSHQELLIENWRILFWLGGVTAIAGVLMRLTIQNNSEIDQFLEDHKPHLFSCLRILFEYRLSFLCIIIATGFSYTTYSLAFTLMNGYIPLITTLSKTKVMETNTFLLIIDMLLLPLFGYLAQRYGKKKVMFFGSICSTLTALPLFSLIQEASFFYIILIRLAIITPGVAFAAPYYAWAIEKVPIQHRYLILSFGGALGSQLIGASSSPISLWLYQITGWIEAPALYLVAIGALASWMTYPFPKIQFCLTRHSSLHQ